MPMPKTRAAPHFSKKPAGFDTFFDNVELLCNRHGIQPADAIQWAIRYAGSAGEVWRTIDLQHITTLPAFKAAVAKCYPNISGKDKYQVKDLQKLVRRSRRSRRMDREDYGAYYRKFTLYAKFLKSITHLSERDERLQFVDGLPESLCEKVLRRLELTHPAVAVSTDYPVADSHEAALRVFSDSDYIK